MVTGVFINPGTGDVDGATEANAIETANRFVQDLGLLNPVTVERNPDKDGCWEGWYAFVLRYGERSCTLDVPGVDPDLVQLGKPWVSPRVYVDGSSWLWGFGLGCAHEYLTGESDCNCENCTH